jgi:hypothetical protein
MLRDSSQVLGTASLVYRDLLLHYQDKSRARTPFARIERDTVHFVHRSSTPHPDESLDTSCCMPLRYFRLGSVPERRMESGDSKQDRHYVATSGRCYDIRSSR